MFLVDYSTIAEQTHPGELLSPYINYQLFPYSSVKSELDQGLSDEHGR